MAASAGSRWRYLWYDNGIRKVDSDHLSETGLCDSVDIV